MTYIRARSVNNVLVTFNTGQDWVTISVEDFRASVTTNHENVLTRAAVAKRQNCMTAKKNFQLTKVCLILPSALIVGIH